MLIDLITKDARNLEIQKINLTIEPVLKALMLQEDLNRDGLITIDDHGPQVTILSS